MASCRRVAFSGGRELCSAVLEAVSQRREQPFSSRADAMAGRWVLRASSCTRSVSTLLQAAG